ncbi:MAG: response regulator, partial [Candidatus Hydrogenedentes bacterium]|nr:response regulator [Candidatus Hydrogenedentota bacterium]
ALRIYRDQGKEIDLVLLDLTMPNMNGEAAHRELRRLDPGVRVILSSGYTEQDVAMRFERKHAARFLQKPYTLAALRDCLRLSMPADPAQE